MALRVSRSLPFRQAQGRVAACMRSSSISTLPALNRTKHARSWSERLGRYGFASDWVETLCLLVKNVLTAPLDERGLFTLSALRAADRLHEVEFHVPLSLITPKGLGGSFRVWRGRWQCVYRHADQEARIQTCQGNAQGLH